MVVPTGKYVINLSGFMQFLIYLSVMINWGKHRGGGFRVSKVQFGFNKSERSRTIGSEAKSQRAPPT